MGRFSGKDILPRSKNFAVRVLCLVRSFSSDLAARELGRQLIRSATSVGANLHEADMADTVKDFCSKVNISQKEACETAYWLSLIHQAGVAKSEEVPALENEAVALQKICRQIIFATRKNEE